MKEGRGTQELSSKERQSSQETGNKTNGSIWGKLSWGDGHPPLFVCRPKKLRHFRGDRRGKGRQKIPGVAGKIIFLLGEDYSDNSCREKKNRVRASLRAVRHRSPTLDAGLETVAEKGARLIFDVGRGRKPTPQAYTGTWPTLASGEAFWPPTQFVGRFDTTHGNKNPPICLFPSID